MTTTHQLASWHPMGLRVAGTQAGERAFELRELCGALERQAAGLDWAGEAARAHLDRAQELRDGLREAARELDVVQQGLYAAAHALDVAQSLLRQAVALAEAHGLQVQSDGAVPLPVLGADDPLLSTAAAAQAQATEALASAEQTDRQTGELLRAAPSLGRGLLALLAAGVLLAQVGRRPLPPPGAGPAVVAAWWAALAPQARHDLERSSPGSLGGLDGVPVDVRDRANRTLLARELLVGLRPGACFDGVLDWAARRDALLVIAAQLERVPGSQLLLFEGGYPGRAAIAVGDVERADHVAVLVPGLGNHVASSLGGLVTSALALQQRATSKRAGTVATVAWIGYDAPNARHVVSPRRARTGAVPLRETLRGLDLRAAAAGRDLHLVLSGHSYGSLVSGFAVRERTGVDDLVVVGSPGLGVERARELWVPEHHVYVGEDRWDPVGWTGRFGRDPSEDDFGARQFQVDGRTDPVLGDLAPIRGLDRHSDYYEAGNESLDNISLITVGQSDRVSYE